MTKPTKWLCAQRRLRSAWHPHNLIRVFACAQWVAKDPSFHHSDSEDSDQTGRMPRLIWVFAGRTCHFVGFVMRRLILCFVSAFCLSIYRCQDISWGFLTLPWVAGIFNFSNSWAPSVVYWSWISALILELIPYVTAPKATMHHWQQLLPLVAFGAATKGNYTKSKRILHH